MMAQALNYTSEGKGETIVFLHGFCESIDIWKDFIKAFTSEYRIVCIDLPGHGKSEGLGKNTTVEKIAELVKETIKALNLEKFILIGHSLGGYVTLSYAQKFSDDLAGICLFHSSAYADSDEKKENRDKTANYVINHGVPAFCNPFVPGLFYHRRKEELKTSIEFATKIALQMKSENVVDTVIAMRDRKETISVLESIKVPVGFIVGKDDTAVPLEKSLSQCHLPAISNVLFLSQTGHMGMLERQLDCKLFLKGFFNQVFQKQIPA